MVEFKIAIPDFLLNLDECYKVENKIVENKSTKYQRIEENVSNVECLLIYVV